MLGPKDLVAPFRAVSVVPNNGGGVNLTPKAPKVKMPRGRSGTKALSAKPRILPHTKASLAHDLNTMQLLGGIVMMHIEAI